MAYHGSTIISGPQWLHNPQSTKHKCENPGKVAASPSRTEDGSVLSKLTALNLQFLDQAMLKLKNYDTIDVTTVTTVCDFLLEQLAQRSFSMLFLHKHYLFFLQVL